jgi:hypothetical protein
MALTELRSINATVVRIARGGTILSMHPPLTIRRATPADAQAIGEVGAIYYLESEVVGLGAVAPCLRPPWTASSGAAQLTR